MILALVLSILWCVLLVGGAVGKSHPACRPKAKETSK